MSLPIESAILSVNGEQHAINTDADGQSLSTKIPLNAGDLKLQATLINSVGEPICGAFYVYVEKL